MCGQYYVTVLGPRSFPFNKALRVVPEGQEAAVYERKADHAEQHFPVSVFHRQLSTPDLSQQSLSRAEHSIHSNRVIISIIIMMSVWSPWTPKKDLYAIF